MTDRTLQSAADILPSPAPIAEAVQSRHLAPMRRAILTTITLSAISAPAIAQTTKGAPPALIGHYGNSPAQCRSYNRKTDNVSVIGRETYTSCAGLGCEAQIVKSKKTTGGYRLHLKSNGNPKGWREEFREISSDIFEIPGVAGRKDTLVRCTRKDITAGIGLAPNTEGETTKALSAVFAAYYAEQVVELCAETALNQPLAKQIIATGADGWEARLKRHGFPPIKPGKTFREGVENDVLREKVDAVYAAKSDAEALPKFCAEAREAFGEGGRVVPCLLIDPRKKA